MSGAASSSRPPGPRPPSPRDARPPAAGVRMEVLPNGLTVLLRETRVAPVAEVQVWAAVGSADERPEEIGLAHFHEHMLFKGTERRGVGEIAGEIEGVGGRINAYTSFDVTVYHATLPAESVAAGVDVLADAAQASVFDPDEVAREIDVVLEEIRRSEDTPHHVLADAASAAAYHLHGYGRPILGSAESVSSFTQAKLLDFYRRWYTTPNLMVVAVGDFDSERVLDAVAEAFADARDGGASRERPVEPLPSAPRHVLLRRPFERASVELSWPGVGLRHLDAPHLDLLGFILGEGDSSRLVQQVKERAGLADRIEASAWTPLDAGLFGAGADTAPEQVAPLVEAIAREVETLRLAPVAERELEKARANFLASESWERESVSGMARKLGSYHAIAGHHQHEAAYLEAIRRATKEDLLRAAQEWLSPERVTGAAVLPEGEATELAAETLGAAVEAGVAAARRAFARPRSGERQADVHGYTLENGLTLHVVARPEVPVVAVRAAMLGGLLLEDDESAGLSHFLAGMWLRGTRGRSAADFARQVEALAADIDGFSGRSSLGFTADCTSDRLLPTLDLLCEAMLEPDFAEAELERERRDTLAVLARREDRLGARAFDLFAATHYREHPYRLPIPGTVDSVTGFDRERVLAHHERVLRGENLVVAVVGDVDPDATALAFGRRLSGLAARSFAPNLPPPEPTPEGVREAEIHKDRAQAHLVIGFRGVDVHDDDREALEVISQLLSGQGGRLFLELRDRRGLAYTVSAVNVEGVAPGYFAVYIATAPEKLDEARTGFFEELDKLLQQAPGEAELEAAKRHLIGNFAIDQQRASVRAAHMALDARYGLGPAADRDFPERVRAIRGKDVLRVARRIIDLERYTLAVVKP